MFNLKSASAGNRTRIYCLEGNNANLYTTDAMATPKTSLTSFLHLKIFSEKLTASAGNRTRIYCLEGNNANLYTTDAGGRRDFLGMGMAMNGCSFYCPISGFLGHVISALVV